MMHGLRFEYEYVTETDGAIVARAENDAGDTLAVRVGFRDVTGPIETDPVYIKARQEAERWLRKLAG